MARVAIILLHVLLVPTSTAACSCNAAPGFGLQLTGAAVLCPGVTFKYDAESEQITVTKDSGTAACLGYAGDGRAAALPCGADEGLQWAQSPFHEATLVNRATMQCLSATNGAITLSECSSSAAQKWAISSAGALHSLANPTDAGSCAVLSPLQGGPCWVNATLNFPGSISPPFSKLGELPAMFGGDVTISAEVNIAKDVTKQSWARVVDFGTGQPDSAGHGDNIILACSEFCVYQVYHTAQTDPITGRNPPSISSKATAPKGSWFRVAVVHQEGVASMYFSIAGGAWELQASGAVDPPARVRRTDNLVGVSNWPADPKFKGQIRSLFTWGRALSAVDLAAIVRGAPPMTGLENLCAAGPAPPAPSSPRSVDLTLDVSKKVGAVTPELYGHDLEFTRHDLFAGLSAELIANRKFAVPTPCEGGVGMKCWPQSIQQMMATNFTPRWAQIGAATLGEPYWQANSSLVSGDVGHSVHCPASSSTACGVTQGALFDGFDSGMSFGSAIVLEEGQRYTLRLVLKAGAATAAAADSGAHNVAVVATLTGSGGRSSDGEASALFSASFTPPAGEWQTFNATFTATATSLNSTLRIATHAAASEWWLGSVSLTPTDNTWRGMRMDVVDSLKATGFRGLFRYPGGCYAPFYRWKIGLLEADARPPIETPPGYCDAVAGGVNAYTDGMMENGISTDDYLALCEYVGLTPAITVRFQEGLPGPGGDVEEAQQWVQYLNGDVSTPYGALRAARGHPEPYNVTYWYLGNEISMQKRYPSYPHVVGGGPPPRTAEYKQMLLNIVEPMIKASTSGALRLLTVSGGTAWDKAWAAAVGAHVFATSFHDGYMTQPRTFTQSAVTACAKRPRGDFMGAVAALRKTLDSTGKTIAISADEWGLGPPWRTHVFAVAHGMYAAGFLGAITRGARANNLQMTNYFEPVNEGAIQVQPFNSSLTPVGLVMRLFSHHTDGILLQDPANISSGDGDLDVTATVAADGASLVVTVANLNAVGWMAYNLALQLHGWQGTKAGVVETLEAEGYSELSMFKRQSGSAAIAKKAGGVASVALHVPPFSVVQATFVA